MGLAKDFKELDVYQNAFTSAKQIFELTKTFPVEERYSLIDQIRRSSRSVCANIAEAWRKRRYPAAFVSKLSDADAEAAETIVWLDVALECSYLENVMHSQLMDQYRHISAQLSKTDVCFRTVAPVGCLGAFPGPYALRSGLDVLHFTFYVIRRFSSMKSQPNLMDKLTSLAKRRGFIFQSSEIYGGLASTWDYGPLGVELKRNVKNKWWRDVVTAREDVVGMDAAILMNPKVWEASGHVALFADDMQMCKHCQKLVRSDQLWDLVQESAWYRSLSDMYLKGDVTGADLKKWGETKAKKLAPNLAIARNPSVTISWLAERMEAAKAPQVIPMRELVQYLATEQLKQDGLQMPCPRCGGELTAPRPFNLMFKTHIGPTEDEGSIAYLRPETAQGIFVNFLNVQVAARAKLPFGIGQIGKAFRNEITTGNFIFRTREFEQMELEFFVRPETTAKWLDYWSNARLEWFASLGINPAKLRLRPHGPDELAHYSTACFDVEYRFPFLQKGDEDEGWGELEGIADRGTYDLTQHQEFSGKKLTYFDPQTNEHIVPAVVESSAGVDRTVLTLLTDAYTEEDVAGETRVVLKLSPAMAPITVAVFPLVNKDGMPETARKLVDDLRGDFAAFYDAGGSIGKRYRRQDEAGTPFGVTIDGQTAEDQTVTIRDRDTMAQVRVSVDKVRGWLREKLR